MIYVSIGVRILNIFNYRSEHLAMKLLGVACRVIFCKYCMLRIPTMLK